MKKTSYICEKFRNEKFRMKNPFKFGTIVEKDHFTSTSSTIIQAFSPALGCHSGSVP